MLNILSGKIIFELQCWDRQAIDKNNGIKRFFVFSAEFHLSDKRENIVLIELRVLGVKRAFRSKIDEVKSRTVVAYSFTKNI